MLGNHGSQIYLADPEGDYTDAERDETYEMVDPALVDGVIENCLTVFIFV